MKKTAFSLVELSIVLVIIGALISTVVVGGKLLDNSKINNLIAKFNEIQTATKVFKEKYKALPGDFSDAQSFFTSSSCPDNSFSSVSCDGDGDHYLEDGENTYAFKHLALAKLIHDKFSPNTYNPPYDNSIADANSDSFNLDGIKGHIAFWEHGTTDLEYRLYFGKVRTTVDANQGKPFESVFTGATAYSLDIKIDDGAFATGEFITTSGIETSGCSAAATDIVCYSQWKEPRF